MVKLGAKLSRKTYRSKFFDDYCMFFVKYFGTVIFVHSASPGVSFAAGMHLECGLSCGETWLLRAGRPCFARRNAANGKRAGCQSVARRLAGAVVLVPIRLDVLGDWACGRIKIS